MKGHFIVKEADGGQYPWGPAGYQPEARQPHPGRPSQEVRGPREAAVLGQNRAPQGRQGGVYRTPHQRQGTNSDLSINNNK